MTFERGIVTGSLLDTGRVAAEIESDGFDGGFTFEGPHDPFFPILEAARATTTLALSTAVAVAFARNPMSVAQQARDLQVLSGGRFALGLGTQIRAHVERRFSMPFDHPAARMREFVLAVRAIWATWRHGTPLDVRGEFYQHTLMTPFFIPGPMPHPDSRILLAGVGPLMVRTAGEVADGLVIHPFHTADHLAVSTLPSFEEGIALANATRADRTVTIQTIVCLGDDEQQVAAARDGARAQLGFYGSTPAYRGMLHHHGFGDLQPRLRELTRSNRWGDLVAAVPDDLVDLVCVSGSPEEVGRQLLVRNAVADTTALVLYNQSGPDGVTRLLEAARNGART